MSDVLESRMAPRAMPALPIERPAYRRQFVRLQWVFVLLGIILTLNLNAIGQRIIGRDQLFSPLILLLCIFAFSNSIHRSWHKLPYAGKALLVGMGFFSLIAFASGFHLPKFPLAVQLVKELSSIVILFAVILVVQSMYYIAGNRAFRFIITTGYVLTFLSTLSIYIPLVYPKWQKLMEAPAAHRFAGVFANPNGAAAAALTFVAISFAMTAMTRKIRWLAIAAPIATVAIYYTGSRTGFFGLLIVSLVLGIMVFPPRRVFQFGAVLIVVGASIYGLLGYVRNQVDEGGYSRNIKRWAGALEILDEGKISDENTAGRVTLTRFAIEYWWEEPIVGHGLGTYRPMPIGLGPHNSFLVILGESGIIGCLPFVYAWIMFLALSLKPRDRILRTYVFGLFLAISIAAASSHSVFTQRNNVFFIACAIAIAGIAHQPARHRPKRVRPRPYPSPTGTTPVN